MALILFSNKFFKNFQINLVGFSLGAHVIKNCLEELNKLNNNENFIKIKNVILIAGATSINGNEWKNIIENTITNKFINCYSKKDWVLRYFYKVSKLFQTEPVGLNYLNIINNDCNLVKNYNFTDNVFGHLSYNYNILCQKIFKDYKDI